MVALRAMRPVRRRAGGAAERRAVVLAAERLVRLRADDGLGLPPGVWYDLPRPLLPSVVRLPLLRVGLIALLRRCRALYWYLNSRAGKLRGRT